MVMNDITTNKEKDYVSELVLEHMNQVSKIEEKWDKDLRELRNTVLETYWNFVEDLDREERNKKVKAINSIKSKEELLLSGFKLMEPRGKKYVADLKNHPKSEKLHIPSKFEFLSSIVKRYYNKKKKRLTTSKSTTPNDPWTLVEDFDGIDSPVVETEQEKMKNAKIKFVKLFMKKLFRDSKSLMDVPRLIQNEKFHVFSIYKRVERMYNDYDDDLYSPYDDSFVFIDQEDESERDDPNRRLCGRVFVIYTSDMSDCIARNYKKVEDEREQEEEFIMFKSRQIYNLYHTRLTALVVNTCLHDDEIMSWSSRDVMSRLSYEANFGQGPDFHFPPFDDQIRSIKQELKHDMAKRQLGQFSITKHSNLSYANMMFHLFSQHFNQNEHSMEDYELVMDGFSKIMGECTKLGVRDLSIQLPISTSFKHPSIDSNLPTGDSIILHIKDLMKIYFKKQTENGSWTIPNLFLYCPRNPKHSSGDFQHECHKIIMEEAENALELSKTNLDLSSSSELDTSIKYLVDAFYKSYLGSAVQLPPSWIKL